MNAGAMVGHSFGVVSAMANSPDPPIRRRRRRNDKPIVVTDDWPEMVPISDLEVRLVEAFFGDLLDELFGPIP